MLITCAVIRFLGYVNRYSLCVIIEIFMVVKMHVVVFWIMTAASSFWGWCQDFGALIISVARGIMFPQSIGIHPFTAWRDNPEDCKLILQFHQIYPVHMLLYLKHTDIKNINHDFFYSKLGLYSCYKAWRCTCVSLIYLYISVFIHVKMHWCVFNIMHVMQICNLHNVVSCISKHFNLRN